MTSPLVRLWDAIVCETCFSGRPAKYRDNGLAMCWVCYRVRLPLINAPAPRLLWLVDNVFDREGGIERTAP